MIAYLDLLENKNISVLIRAEGENGIVGDYFQEIDVDGDFMGMSYDNLLLEIAKGGKLDIEEGGK